MWIRYDPESGQIYSLTNELNKSLPGVYSPIDIFTVEEFVQGTKVMGDFIAVPDPLNPELCKLINTKEEQMDYDISKSIYQITKTHSNIEANFTICQQSDRWLVYITQKLIDIIKDNDYYAKKVYNFYITNENDPNILLDKFVVNMEDLIKGPIEIKDIDKSVCLRKDVSIYAYRLFDTYQHWVMI